MVTILWRVYIQKFKDLTFLTKVKKRTLGCLCSLNLNIFQKRIFLIAILYLGIVFPFPINLAVFFWFLPLFVIYIIYKAKINLHFWVADIALNKVRFISMFNYNTVFKSNINIISFSIHNTCRNHATLLHYRHAKATRFIFDGLIFA